MPAGPVGAVIQAANQFTGAFDPGVNPVRIQYRNYRGEDVEYAADRSTLRNFETRISIQVAPRGARITLEKKFVRNLAALGDLTRVGEPSGVDRQVLTYHLRRGSTSPRFEQLRRKYPNWKP